MFLEIPWKNYQARSRFLSYLIGNRFAWNLEKLDNPEIGVLRERSVWSCTQNETGHPSDSKKSALDTPTPTFCRQPGD